MAELPEEQPLEVLNIAEQTALANPVILETVFNWLDFESRKEFRIVNQNVFRETLALWRRSTWIAIGWHENVTWRDMNSWANLYFELGLEKWSNGEPIADKYFQTEHPFRSFKISLEKLERPVENSYRIDVQQRCHFWMFFGPNITHLYLESLILQKDGILKGFKWLVLDACPNLKSLQIEFESEHSDWDKDMNTPESEEEEDKEGMEGVEEAEDKSVNENLQTLILLKTEECTLPSEFANVFKIIPNLKHLQIEVNEADGGEAETSKILEGLLQPCLNGEFIKLESFTSKSCPFESFHPLVEYTAMEETIKSLHFRSFDYLDYGFRKEPFHVYKIIAQSQNLEKLELSCDCYDGEAEWLMDLSTITFPALKSLKLELQKNVGYLKFDFGTLSGMQKLNTLCIKTKSRSFAREINEGVDDRLVGDADWLFEGQRDNFVPSGEVVKGFKKFNPSCKLPPHCKSLRRLEFIGWPLNLPDLEMFHDWFPNLERVKARFTSEEVVQEGKRLWEGVLIMVEPDQVEEDEEN